MTTNSFDKIVFLTTHSIPILCHLIGIYFLRTSPFKTHWQRIQRKYLLWLSTIEVILVSHDIIYPHIKHYGRLPLHASAFITGGFGTLMLLILMTMTIDRALFVYLSFKYDSNKVTKATHTGFAFNILVSIMVSLVLLLTQQTQEQFNNTKTLYFWPILDLCTMVVYVTCYAFIVKTVQERSRTLHGVESEVYKKRMKNATKLPKLIVCSYLICWTFFNIMFIFFHVGLLKTNRENYLPSWIILIANIFYCAGYSTDAIFYIFFIRQIRLTLKEKLYHVVVLFQRRRIRTVSKISLEKNDIWNVESVL
eukprot:TCONS_00008370-protein